ncbi:MAG: amidohydrolase [Bacteroidetes bacterium]|nr:amidohydrolase [Bacteroidota bacterium]
MRPKVVDIHIHIQPWWQLKPEIRDRMAAGKDDFEGLLDLMKNPAHLIKIMDDSDIEKVGLINYVSPDLMGFDETSNDFSAEYQKFAPDRFIAFGSVHPRFVKDADAEIHRLIQDLGIRAVKIHPPHQLFYPNDYLSGMKNLEVVYRRCEEWGIPVMFHTGTSFFSGARIKYGDPMCLDDVALDFPKLKMIMAHGGRPLWMDTAFYLLRRHRNLWLDISSIPPKKLISDYFPRLEEVADRTLFGTDWPGPMVQDIRKNADEFLSLPLSEKAKKGIIRENALKLFESH